MPTDPEAAVRRYLLYLANPESLRDDAAISKAETAVSKAKDPIDRLKAMAALDRARTVDGDKFRADFVTHAKAWADAENIPAKAFVEMGVPIADLAAAGLVAPRGKGTKAASGRGRAPRLDLNEVAAALPKGEFLLSTLAANIGREVTTTRNYLNKLVENGVVVTAGEDPNHDGRGKAARLYRKA